jgi:hypothetical protein
LLYAAGFLLWPFFALYHWIFRTFFRERFEERLARGDAAGRTMLEAAERDEPAMFERATGRKARSASELPASLDRPLARVTVPNTRAGDNVLACSGNRFVVERVVVGVVVVGGFTAWWLVGWW